MTYSMSPAAWPQTMVSNSVANLDRGSEAAALSPQCGCHAAVPRRGRHLYSHATYTCSNYVQSIAVYRWLRCAACTSAYVQCRLPHVLQGVRAQLRPSMRLFQEGVFLYVFGTVRTFTLP